MLERRIFRGSALFANAVLALLCVSCARTPSDSRLAEAVRTEAARKMPPDYTGAGGGSEQTWQALQRFYAHRQYRPAWTGSGKQLSLSELAGALCTADQEALRIGAYHLDSLAQLHAEAYEDKERNRQKLAERWARLDVALSYAFLTYGSHLVNGTARPQWRIAGDSTRVEEHLQRALESGGVRKALDGLLPVHPQYLRLKQALERYRRMADTAQWPTVNGPEDLNNLAARLIAASDLDKAQAGAAKAVPAALKRFQRRHGLTESGKADTPTLEALNVPIERRIRQIEINMERWRWLPRNLGRRYIMVNVPAFELQAVEQGAVRLKMPVVVGKEYKPTPLFSDTMTHIVLSPYWNIPQSIVREEILPAVQRDPGYFMRHEIEVIPAGSKTPVDPATIDWATLDSEELPYQLRQLPGENNSLGRVKFMLPNQFDIYLHDTPADHLFDRKKRDFSHGCIRVARPYELAEWALGRDPQWTVDSIRTAASTDTERTLSLPDPAPVYILYLTAWVDDDGSVSFRDDLYDQDKQLFERLEPLSDEERARAACGSLLEKTRH